MCGELKAKSERGQWRVQLRLQSHDGKVPQVILLCLMAGLIHSEENGIK